METIIIAEIQIKRRNMKNRDLSQQYYMPLHYLLRIIEIIEERGYNFEPVKGSRVFAILQKQDSSAKIGYSSFSDIVNIILETTQDTSLGLYLGSKMPLTANRFVGYAIVSSSTLRHALDIAQKYLPTLHNILEFQLIEHGKTASIRIHAPSPLGEIDYFIYDMVLSFINTYVNFFNIHKDSCQRVTFTQLQPPHEWLYNRYFNQAPVIFGTPYNEYFFNSDILDHPSEFHDQTSFELAVEQCEKELKQILENESVSLAVITLLTKQSSYNLTLETVADLLKVSPRTLRRKLADENTNYQRIQKKVKCDISKEYLARSAMPINEIAEVLGYNDFSSFGKAFKQWTGLSPRDYRKQHQVAK